MRFYLLFYALLTLVPGAVIAQDSTKTKTFDKQWFDLKFKSESELRSLAPQSGITSIPSTKSDSSSAFSRHLPKFYQQKQIVINEPSEFHSNMPIVKPRKTSKILIAKLDPEFPYLYNMPVKKVGGDE